jgi:hypothetical protein
MFVIIKWKLNLLPVQNQSTTAEAAVESVRIQKLAAERTTVAEAASAKPVAAAKKSFVINS